MTKKIVDLLNAITTPKVKAVAFGSYTTPPAAPYVVVKPEFAAQKARWRIVAHYLPAAILDLEKYMRVADAALDGWTGADEDGVVNSLAYVEGSASTITALSDDKTIAMERVYEAPDFV